MLDALANPRRIPPTAAPNYQSVKLPSYLVTEAKEHAQAFRRSTAAQIEYWAALGKNVERQGLTTMQAKQALEQNDREIQLHALIANIKTVSQTGELSTAIQTVIADNRQKAVAKTAAQQAQ